MRNARTTLPVLAVAAILASCSIPDNDSLLDNYPNYSPSHPRDEGREDKPPVPEIPDTAVLITAVQFKDKYDYIRDTAQGLAVAELVLLADFKPLMAIPTGPDALVGTDPFSHHIVGNHLFTEFTHPGGTAIGKDGRIILEYPEKEKLAGVVEAGDSSVWTLGLSGNGFTLRKDGAIVLSRPESKVFGGFDDINCPPGGALYRHGDHIVFFFAADVLGQEDYYAVEDGLCHCVRPFPSIKEMYDIKLINGRPQFLLKDNSGRVCCAADSSDIRYLIPRGGGNVTSGSLIPYTRGCPVAKLEYSRDGKQMEAIFKDGNEMVSYPVEEGKATVWCGTGPHRITLPKDYMMMGPRCISTTEGRIAVALSSKRLSFPAISDGTNHMLLNVNGFLSSIRVPGSSRSILQAGTRRQEPSGGLEASPREEGRRCFPATP